MILSDRMTATTPIALESADGEKRIPAGAHVTLTLLDATSIGVHFNGTSIIASLVELMGAELHADVSA